MAMMERKKRRRKRALLSGPGNFSALKTGDSNEDTEEEEVGYGLQWGQVTDLVWSGKTTGQTCTNTHFLVLCTIL